MNYKEIVDLLGSIADYHKMIADWGYGELSDIKTRAENTTGGADYPYMFINPAGGVRDNRTVTWTFNLVMMEIVGPGDDFLQVQSDCAQYLADVLAYLELKVVGPNAPQPVYSTQLQPFKERFQDQVAGMTGVLQVIVPDPLNDCITPFADPLEFIEEDLSTNDLIITENGLNIIEETP
jgi:hypothetical protein